MFLGAEISLFNEAEGSLRAERGVVLWVTLEDSRHRCSVSHSSSRGRGDAQHMDGSVMFCKNVPGQAQVR